MIDGEIPSDFIAQKSRSIQMRFSLNWLKRHIETDLSIYKLAEKLTAIGLEVDAIEDPEKIFINFKLVRIEYAEKHPNADKLQICTVVDVNNKKYRVVCGAKNVRDGLKTVMAMPGAIIPSTGEVLKRGKIRGEESEGMLCSFGELALPEKSDGIIELDDDVFLGTPVGDLFGYDGGILDVAVTPNRGDCFSVKGIARDLAAAGVGYLENETVASCSSVTSCDVKINYLINEAVSSYAPFMLFRAVRGIKNTDESPAWLQTNLRIANQSSISRVVDLANWWMFDTGKPLHIYDLNKIDGEISIRFAKNNENFIDIKGISRKLREDMLVCADEKDVLCLLGVIGGKKAACTKDTTDILIESALFDPIFVFKTGNFLNINSDSRARFERGIDRSTLCPDGITNLILENCGGNPTDVITFGNPPTKIGKEIKLTKSKLNKVIGCEIDWNNARLILQKLGLIEKEERESESVFLTPGWRSDLNIEEDLIEEILRISGYEKIPERAINVCFCGVDNLLKEKNIIISMKKTLASRGMSEVISYPFIKYEHADIFRENKKLINLINPINIEMNVMRTSLVPNLLRAAIRSLNYGQKGVAICESGNIFFDDCVHEMHLAGLRVGIGNKNWRSKANNIDVFDIKNDILSIIKFTGCDEKNVVIQNDAPSYYHPSRSGTIFISKKKIGFFGELHPKVNKIFDITDRLLCFEIFLENLLSISKKKPTYIEKVYPKISRDFSFVFDATEMVGNILHGIYKIDTKISQVDVFDCFDIGNGKKSIGISVIMSTHDRTMTEDEAQSISDRIIHYVEKSHGELRKK